MRVLNLLLAVDYQIQIFDNGNVVWYKFSNEFTNCTFICTTFQWGFSFSKDSPPVSRSTHIQCELNKFTAMCIPTSFISAKKELRFYNTFVWIIIHVWCSSTIRLYRSVILCWSTNDSNNFLKHRLWIYNLVNWHVGFHLEDGVSENYCCIIAVINVIKTALLLESISPQWHFLIFDDFHLHYI